MSSSAVSTMSWTCGKTQSSSGRETGDRLVIPHDLGELVQELVHPLPPFGREGAYRLGQILGVVIRRRHVRCQR